MKTATMMQTHNTTMAAQTCNHRSCSAKSKLCSMICYGPKMKGLAHIGQSWAIKPGRTAKEGGWFRPFTISGDIPMGQRPFGTFMRSMERTARGKVASWFPTRIWSKSGGLDRIRELLNRIPNATIMLSFDGSMSANGLAVACKTLQGEYPGRISASMIVDPPAEAVTKLGALYDAVAVSALQRGAHRCVKTYAGGTCARDCGRVCYDPTSLPIQEALTVPMVIFKYHK